MAGVFHGNDVRAQCLDVKDLARMREPAVHALREHCRESEPVGVHILEKAVVGVLRELLVKTPNPLLHVETTHAEDIAENIGE